MGLRREVDFWTFGGDEVGGLDKGDSIIPVELK